MIGFRAAGRRLHGMSGSEQTLKHDRGTAPFGGGVLRSLLSFLLGREILKHLLHGFIDDVS